MPNPASLRSVNRLVAGQAIQRRRRLPVTMQVARRALALRRAAGINPTRSSPGFTLRKRGFHRFEDGSIRRVKPLRRIGKSARVSSGAVVPPSGSALRAAINVGRSVFGRSNPVTGPSTRARVSSVAATPIAASLNRPSRPRPPRPRRGGSARAL